MEGLEIHPLSTRTVCLNLPHLKPWWMTQALSSSLGCFYNPHQPQIIWREVTVQLPTPRILRIKGHASHPVPAMEMSKLKADAQMGTYILFHIPVTKGRSSPSQLVLNGVQSVVREKENPSFFSLHLMTGTEPQHPTDPVISPENCCTKKAPNYHHRKLAGKDETNTARDRDKTKILHPLNQGQGFTGHSEELPHSSVSLGSSVENFGGIEEVTTILEDESDPCPHFENDSDDASEDIHKVVLRRLVIDITVLMRRWEESKTENNLLVLLLKPEQRGQAWQYLTSWIMVRERTSDEGTPATTLTRRKAIIRAKQPPQVTHTNIKKKTDT